MDLAGQAVIVTGSSSGIGEAVARRLAGLGAGVVVNSATSAAAGKQVAADLPDAVYVQGDIGDPATAAALIAAAEQRWGRLDGLVNNAGVTVDVPLPDLDAVTVEHWNTVLRTNVVGTFLVSQAALPLLRQADDGWIINITSLAGVRQTGSSLPYAVSKAALDHMTTIMAKHVGAGVRDQRRRARARRDSVDRGLARTQGRRGTRRAAAPRRHRRGHRRRHPGAHRHPLRDRADPGGRRRPRPRHLTRP